MCVLKSPRHRGVDDASALSTETQRFFQDVNDLPVSSWLPGGRCQLALPSERQDGLGNDLHPPQNLILLDHKRRRKSDDIAVGWLGQKSIISKSQTHLPSVVI